MQILTRLAGGESIEERDASAPTTRSEGDAGPAYRIGNRIVVKTPNLIDVSLGARLRDKRMAMGWSQDELARKVEIDPKDISGYETGAKRIAANRLLRLSKVLGVKPVYFFGFEDHERHAPQHGPRLTLPDQGLRLHRAFISVKSPALREAIVSLVTELARNDDPS